MSKNHPVDCANSAAPARNGLTLAQAIAWCQSMPDCAGMWFYDNGRTCPKAHWDPSPSNFSKVIAGGSFYQVRCSFPSISVQQSSTAAAYERSRCLGWRSATYGMANVTFCTTRSAREPTLLCLDSCLHTDCILALCSGQADGAACKCAFRPQGWRARRRERCDGLASWSNDAKHAYFFPWGSRCSARPWPKWLPP